MHPNSFTALTRSRKTAAAVTAHREPVTLENAVFETLVAINIAEAHACSALTCLTGRV